jgi:hypothetical protein
MSEEKKDFVVKDRRIFSQDTEAADDGSQAQAPPSAEEAEPQTQAESSDSAERPKTDDQPPFPEINFQTFVASLNASALVHLGAIEDPASGQKMKNLPMAKQTIDILSMLEKKTDGNLSTEEENLLKGVLYDLRIMYVRERK